MAKNKRSVQLIESHASFMILCSFSYIVLFYLLKSRKFEFHRKIR